MDLLFATLVLTVAGLTAYVLLFPRPSRLVDEAHERRYDDLDPDDTEGCKIRDRYLRARIPPPAGRHRHSRKKLYRRYAA